MAKTTPSSTKPDAPSSSETKTTQDRTATTETARERYINASLTNPRLKRLAPSGKTYVITGSHLTSKKDTT